MSAPRGTDVEWHEANRLPRRASLDQRVHWHLEHARECDCREIPPGIVHALLALRRRTPIRAAAAPEAGLRAG
jgi:hypothetical protein